MQLSDKQKLRFSSRVKIVPSGCHEWTGASIWGGYGRVTLNYRQYLAHRVSFSIEHGEIPDRMVVCHSCDNRKCVNPKHLFLGTQKENMADAQSKGRTKVDRRQKITRRQAETIRKDKLSTSIFELARQYSVTPASISHIINQKTFV